LVDGDLVLTESRAAAAYLISKYGNEKKEKLYPTDPKTR
jgi:glutathione S-transferase